MFCRFPPPTTTGPTAAWTTSWGSPTTHQRPLQSRAGLLSVRCSAWSLQTSWAAPVLLWWVRRTWHRSQLPGILSSYKTPSSVLFCLLRSETPSTGVWIWRHNKVRSGIRSHFCHLCFGFGLFHIVCSPEFWKLLCSLRGGCRAEAPDVRSASDAAAGSELLPPAPGGLHQRLQLPGPDASVELLHHRQAGEPLLHRVRVQDKGFKLKWNGIIHLAKQSKFNSKYGCVVSWFICT